MNRPDSLTAEKEALLAKMEASRVAYRRMLQGTDSAHTRQIIDDVTPTHAFPKSKTVRFILDHPYLCAMGVAILLLGPRRLGRTARTVAQRGSKTTSLLIRNQNKIRMAFGLGTGIARLIAQRRKR